MILDPRERSLYSDALRPPPDTTFDRGIATTFTLDLTTLLIVPLHLTLFASGESTEKLITDGVDLLEALRRTTERLQVFCHQGEIHVPTTQSALFSLLEPVVVEARAPRGGVFHPKLWVLRFLGDDPDHPILRLLVLSRNLTADHAWDLILSLEGSPGRKRRKASAPLAQLLEELPSMVAPGARQPDARFATSLADEVARTAWEPPDPFDSIRFHTIGLSRGRWTPPDCEQLLVLSPFVSDAALRSLT